MCAGDTASTGREGWHCWVVLVAFSLGTTEGLDWMVDVPVAIAGGIS